MPKNKQFLLDTHIWIWLLNGEPMIEKSPVFDDIATASRQNGLHISSISIWELAMLEARGRIAFSASIFS